MGSVYQSRLMLNPLHLLDHAVRVDILYGTGLREPRDLLVIELPTGGPEVVFELFETPRPDYWRRHALLPEEPVQRYLRVGLAGLLGDLTHHFERAPVALDVAPDPRLLELVGNARDARVLRRLLAAPVLAREEAAAQRTPRYDPNALLPAGRQHLPLDVPLHERVLRLQAHEPLEALKLAHVYGLHELPAREVGDPDVAHLAGSHQVRERRQGLIQGRRGVPHVHLVEVYVVRAEPPEARLAARQYVLAREADVVRTVAHREAHLRGEHQLVPASILYRAAEDLLGGTVLVDVGGVHEVAAGFEEAGGDPLRTLLVELPPERHGPEAQLGDHQPRPAQTSVLHITPPQSALSKG